MRNVRVGLIGAQFVSTIHLESLRAVPGAEVIDATAPAANGLTPPKGGGGARHAARESDRMSEARP